LRFTIGHSGVYFRRIEQRIANYQTGGLPRKCAVSIGRIVKRNKTVVVELLVKKSASRIGTDGSMEKAAGCIKLDGQVDTFGVGAVRVDRWYRCTSILHAVHGTLYQTPWSMVPVYATHRNSAPSSRKRLALYQREKSVDPTRIDRWDMTMSLHRRYQCVFADLMFAWGSRLPCTA
jgi:hypothetical protein